MLQPKDNSSVHAYLCPFRAEMNNTKQLNHIYFAEFMITLCDRDNVECSERLAAEQVEEEEADDPEPVENEVVAKKLRNTCRRSG